MYGSSSADLCRDDRHIRLAGRMGIDEHSARTKFLKSTVLLTGDSDVLSRADGRVMALTALNLITRFCPRIDIFMPGAPILAKELASLGREIDRSQDAMYQVLSSVDSTSDYEAVLSVGGAPLSLPNTTEITASGWLAGVSSTEPAPILPEGWCGPGALAAAALGASQIFIRLLEPPKGAAKLSPPLVFSTYDFSVQTQLTGFVPDPGPVIEDVDLPSILVGGCGAVGQALIYCLLALPVRASRVWVVDHDHISLTNLNRCMLAFQRHVEGHALPLKVTVVEEATKGTSLHVYADSRPLDEALKDRRAYPFGYPTVVVCGVDNGEARGALQRLWPDLFLEGSTGDAQIQALRWAYGRDQGCSFCYHSDVQTKVEPYHERMAARSGLSAERISASLVSAEAAITEADVLAAPEGMKAFLAEQKGRAICSVLSDIERFSKSQDAPEEPSVSFASFLAGVILAAEIVKPAAELPQHLDSQFMADTLFPVHQSEIVQLAPIPNCYCQRRRNTIVHFRQVAAAETQG